MYVGVYAATAVLQTPTCPYTVINEHATLPSARLMSW
jgi:hypothetical protein